MIEAIRDFQLNAYQPGDFIALAAADASPSCYSRTKANMLVSDLSGKS
jgi:hypothetical protein